MLFVHLVRYKYENDRVMDVSSTEISSPLQYQLYGTGKIGVEMPSRGSQNQLLERQVPLPDLTCHLISIWRTSPRSHFDMVLANLSLL